MATLEIMYNASGGLVLGQMRGCYLKSEGGLHPLGGLCNILIFVAFLRFCLQYLWGLP